MTFSFITSLLTYVFVQTFGLAIAFVAAAILLYMVLSRLHSRGVALVLVAVFIGISLFFYVPNGLPHGLEYTALRTTYGPAAGPGLPFGNVLNFFAHLNRFERVKDIARDPNDVPAPITRTATTTVTIDLTAKEVISELAPGVYQNYWTYGGTVPGPMERVMVGDTVIVNFHNDPTSLHHHTVDFHAVIGPGGGSGVLMAQPGETKTLTFTALHPGVFVYHCAEPNAAVHISHGQYGLIVVEPQGGLPTVDKEFYVVQGEFYTSGTLGQRGLQIFDTHAMIDGRPQYVVFNGRTGALTKNMNVTEGQTVRIFFGNAGVNLVSSFHVIGEVFDRVYREGSLSSAPETDVQTTTVPAGGATAVEFATPVPGTFVLVDHALARMDRGAWGLLHVEGPDNPAVFKGEAQEHAH